METKTFNIEARCLFCDSPLKVNAEKRYVSGDLIKCQECGEQNDYDSLVDVDKEETKILAEKLAKEEIEKALKKVFKR